VAAGVLATSALFPAATILAPHVAAADPVCGPTTNGVTKLTTSVTSKDVTWTHKLVVASLAPGASVSRTLTSTTTLTATVTFTAGVKAEAGAIIAKAETSFGFQLQGSGSHTDTESVTLSKTNTSSSIKSYVFFDGTRRGIGKWVQLKCQFDSRIAEWVYKSIGTGAWDSWEIQNTGVLDCASDAAVKTKFGSFSVEYVAVASC